MTDSAVPNPTVPSSATASSAPRTPGSPRGSRFRTSRVVVAGTSVALAVALALTMALTHEGGSGSVVTATAPAERSRPEASGKPPDDLLVAVVTGLLDEVLDGEHHSDRGDSPTPGRDGGSGGSDTGTRGS